MEKRLRQDFPVDWDEDNYVSRREFFKFLTLASGGLALGSIGLAAWSQVPRKERTFDRALIAREFDIPVGSSLAFSYPRPQDLCLLIHDEPGHYVAFSRRCTHLSCPVEYQPSQHRVYCPCHNGAFSLEDGRVLQGPPPRPLPRIQLEKEGDQIFATGIVEPNA
jgi:nitrite reductase/ring-hydroxylating ferredoxin subunit